MVEQVLVVRREDLLPPGCVVPDGVSVAEPESYLERIARRGFYTPRDAAEADPSLKQIIPYGVLVCGSQVFLMRRKRGGGEPRLHQCFSIGVGGHINPRDEAPGGTVSRDIVAEAFRREMDEELHVETPYEIELVGTLNDDSNSVGLVHFGVVYRLSLQAARVRVRELHELEGSFVKVGELGGYVDRMETWSRHLIRHLWPLRSSAPTAIDS